MPNPGDIEPKSEIGEELSGEPELVGLLHHSLVNEIEDACVEGRQCRRIHRRLGSLRMAGRQFIQGSPAI